jgi:uncharacterized HhH-GPD family protein
MMDKNIVKAMLAYISCPNFRRRLKSPSLKEWGLSKESVKLLEKDVNAFFLAAIFDRRITAEQAWEIPYQLKKRLGHLDVNKIAKMDVKSLAEYIGPQRFGRSLHRNYNIMSSCLVKACQLLINRYGGYAGNIWEEDRKVYEVRRKLLEFKGIGQKIANMFIRLLITYYGVSLTGWKDVDIAVDRHVARVFLRTGLIHGEKGKTEYHIGEVKDNIIRKTRELFPKYPGALDEPAFSIGKNWCTAEKAYCDYKGDPCPLTKVCSKKRKDYQIIE